MNDTFNMTGSISTNDLLIEIYFDCPGLIVNNLDKNTDKRYLTAQLKQILAAYNLRKHGIIIYYNGASASTIKKRCLALKKSIKH